MAVVPRYKCKCCKYKKKIRSFAHSCVHYDLEDQQFQILCSYCEIPIKKPDEWTALDSKQSYPRPSAWWALDHQGFIKMWCQRPYKLEDILRNKLHRDDLAGKLQELLDKYPTVKERLEQFKSNDTTPSSSYESPDNYAISPIQETTTTATATAVKVGENKTDIENEPVLKTETPMESAEKLETVPEVTLDLPPSNEEHHHQPDTNQLQPVENELSQSVKVHVGHHRSSRDSDWFKRRSSGFSERTISRSGTISSIMSGGSDYSNLQRADSGISIRKRTNESLASAVGHSLALSEIEESSDKPLIDGFCSDCRSWINNISPHGSLASSSPSPPSPPSSPSPPSPPSLPSPFSPSPSSPPPDNVNSKTNSSATEDSQSLTSSASASCKFERSIPTSSDVEFGISGRIEVKRKELVKNLGSSKRSWLRKSSQFPEMKQLQGRTVQFRMKLHAQSHDVSESAAAASESQSCATISLDAIPAIPVSQDASHVLPTTVYLSVYATNEKTATDTNRTIIMNNTKQEVEETTIKEATEIAQFPGVITPELLKRLEEKYIVTEVRVVYPIVDK